MQKFLSIFNILSFLFISYIICENFSIDDYYFYDRTKIIESGFKFFTDPLGDIITPLSPPEANPIDTMFIDVICPRFLIFTLCFTLYRFKFGVLALDMHLDFFSFVKGGVWE